MTNLDSIFKSRDITLLAKVRVVKVMVFPVVMYGCESWTVKNAEHWETDAFGLWCWRRLLRVPWISGSSNLSILEEIILNIVWKDCCWSWSSNTLATWYEELTHWKRLMLGKIEGRRRRGWDGWMASPTQWSGVWASSRRWKAWCAVVHGVTKSRMLLNNKPHFMCAFKEEGPTEWLEYLLGSGGSRVKNTPNVISGTMGEIRFTCLH